MVMLNQRTKAQKCGKLLNVQGESHAFNFDFSFSESDFSTTQLLSSIS